MCSGSDLSIGNYVAALRKQNKEVQLDATSRIPQSSLVSIKQLIKELDDDLYM